ncbi:hypothetical protein E5E97_19930 [Aeromonas sp. 2692-1]|uniref:hypothetical protein n=1 Tax=Aeromonas sp. 2692-1 TaxID=2560029 RepID=UPI00148B0BA8|nr:hypothetical protein [Aeromonas sp. 2692-1]QJT14955.1 hypothetical protein E5E97_19930 [Aeromonas sp. 2692-1]
MFCGNYPDTKEHVIPQWMHRKYDIKHSKLKIRNDSEVKYINEVLPACKSCNGIRFSQIEERIKNGDATEQELFVWALKIYVGLNLKDSQFPEDRKDKSKGMVLTYEEVFKGIEFARSILANFGNPGFSLYPAPFGSVIITDLPDYIEPSFALSSIGYPYNIITIIMNDKQLLTVILNDFGLVKRQMLNDDGKHRELLEHFFKRSVNTEEQFTANNYAQQATFYYSKLKAQMTIPKRVTISNKRVAAMSLPKKVKPSKLTSEFIVADLAGKLFKINV